MQAVSTVTTRVCLAYPSSIEVCAGSPGQRCDSEEEHSTDPQIAGPGDRLRARASAVVLLAEDSDLKLAAKPS